MNWRTTQLGDQLCDQDQVILDLVAGRPVRVHGNHNGFDRWIQIDDHSDFCLIFINQPFWLSQVRDFCVQHMRPGTRQVYIGINRYQIKGNDTDYQAPPHLSPGQALLRWLGMLLEHQGFIIRSQNCLERDRGRYFNAVQPLTWIYAEHETDPGR